MKPPNTIIAKGAIKFERIYQLFSKAFSLSFVTETNKSGLSTGNTMASNIKIRVFGFIDFRFVMIESLKSY